MATELPMDRKEYTYQSCVPLKKVHRPKKDSTSWVYQFEMFNEIDLHTSK